MPFGLCPLPIHVWGPCSEKGACFKLLQPLRSPTPASAPPHGRPPWPTLLPSSPGSAQSSDLWASCLLKEVSLNPSPRSKVGQFSCFVYTVPHCTPRNTPHSSKKVFNCALYLSFSLECEVLWGSEASSAVSSINCDTRHSAWHGVSAW